MAKTSMAKPVAERVAALRQRREAQGLTRLELYAHPDDAERIRTYATKLALKREKEKK
jgi:hypothetical protein